MELLLSCPRCNQQLKIQDSALGKSIRCPCGNVFVAHRNATRPPVAPPPPAPAGGQPRPPAATPAPANVLMTCPHCRQQMGVPATARGRQVKCPRCGGVVAVPAAPSPAGVPLPSPLPPRPPAAIPLGRPAPMPPGPAPVRAAAANPMREAIRNAPPQPQAFPTPTAPKKPLNWRLLAIAGGAGAGLLILVLVLLRIFNRGAPSEEPTPSKPTLNVAFIPEDCSTAVIIQPQRIFGAKALKALSQDKMFAPVKSALGLDPRDIEQVVLVLDNSPLGKSPVSGGAILHFTRDVEGKKLLDKTLDGVEEKTFQGKTYFQARNEIPAAEAKMCGFVADDRTLVVAPEATLLKMLTPGEGKSPLIERLRGADLDNDVIGMVLMEPYREKLQQLVSAAGESIPPTLAEIKKLPEQLQAATLAFNLDGDNLLRIVLDTDSADSSKAVGELLDMLVLIAKQTYKGKREDLLSQVPPDSRASVGTVTDELLAGISVNTDGKQVTLLVKTPRGLPQLVEKLAPLIPK